MCDCYKDFARTPAPTHTLTGTVQNRCSKVSPPRAAAAAVVVAVANPPPAGSFTTTGATHWQIYV